MRDHKDVIGTIVRLTNGPIMTIFSSKPRAMRGPIALGEIMKITETDNTELVLDSYLMQIHQNSCRCGSGERYGQMFEVWTHPTKTRLNGFRMLKPAGNGPLRAGLPVAYVDMPRQHNVICSDCVQHYQPAPKVQAIPALSEQQWAETLRRKYTPEPSAPKVAKSAGADAGIPAPRPDQL